MADYASELSELLPESSGDGSKGIGINVRRLLKMRARYMVAALLLIVVPAAVLIWMKVPTTFTATARIEFKPQKQELLAAGNNFQSSREYREYVLTQMEIITGYSTMSTLMEDESISALTSIVDHSNPYSYLMGNVEAKEEVATNLVTVSFTSSDRNDAIAVADGITAAYVANAAEREKLAGGDKLAESLQLEVDLKEQIDIQEKDVEQLARELGVSTTGNYEENNPESDNADRELVTAQADRIRAENKKRQIEEDVKRTQLVIGKYNEDVFAPVLFKDTEREIDKFHQVTLQNETVSAIQRDFTIADKSLREGTSRLRALKDDLDSAIAVLEKKRAGFRGEVLASILNTLQQDLESCEADLQDADIRLTTFEKRLAERRKETLERGYKFRDVQNIKYEIQVKRTRLEQTQDSILLLKANAESPARAEVVEAAAAPESPNYKDRIKFIILAIMFGTTVAAGLGIMLEVLDQNIRSAQDIGYVSDLPVLATIPHSKEEKFPRKTDMATITSTHPNSMTADQFRQAVARLLHSDRRGHEFKTCAVVSPVNGDGKTTLAANLAIALAQADRKTLLIDVDSRNPNIEAAFGLEPASGLSEMLSRDKLARDPDRRTEFENLYILGPGLQSNNLVERLASKEMKDFLQGSSRLFDNIIIDTPSVLIASESKLIAPLVDGVIVVAGAGRLTFGKLQRGIRVMEECGARILGVVVNGVRHTSGGYLRENIKAYYKPSGGKRHQLPKGKNGNGHRKPVEKPVETVTVPAQNSDEEL